MYNRFFYFFSSIFFIILVTIISDIEINVKYYRCCYCGGSNVTPLDYHRIRQKYANSVIAFSLITEVSEILTFYEHCEQVSLCKRSRHSFSLTDIKSRVRFGSCFCTLTFTGYFEKFHSVLLITKLDFIIVSSTLNLPSSCC